MTPEQLHQYQLIAKYDRKAADRYRQLVESPNYIKNFGDSKLFEFPRRRG